MFAVTDVFSHIEVAEGRVWLLRDGVEYFAGDLTAEEQELTWATAMSPVADLFTQKVEGVAWRSKPSWYIVGNERPHRKPGSGALRGGADGGNDV